MLMDGRTPITALLTLTLLLAAAPGVAADGQDHAADAPGAEARSYADQWLALKAQLGQGNVTGARATWNATFAPAAATHPLAGEYAVRALDALEADGNTSSATWAAWSQVVDKSTYAVAYASVDDALEAGDIENATAWFGLLSAKFKKDSELVVSKSLFTNMTANQVFAAEETLRAELTDLMHAKVHKEAAEVPGLLVADPLTAAKEAGEALGYFLTIEPAYRAAFGDAAADDALHVLEDLVEHTLEGDADEVAHYALEAQNVAARHAFATSSLEAVNAFTLIADAMKKDKNVTDARYVYGSGLDHVAEESVPATHERILTAFDDMEAALAANDTVAYDNARQVAEKSLYHVALAGFEHEALEGETDEALEYYRILAKKFGWDEETPGVLAAGRLAAANAVNDEDVAAAKAEAFHAFFLKVQEEVQEVFMHWENNPKAQVKAIEGVAYYAPLHEDVAARLGDAVAEELELELVALFDATKAGDRKKADQAADEVAKLLVAYESGGADVTELDRVVSALKGKIAFVDEEYRGYYEALEAGDEKEAAVELGETKAFLSGARQQFADNADAFAAAMGEAFVQDVLERMDRIAVLVEDLVPYEDVESEALELVSLLGTVTAPANGTPDETFGASTLTLEAPRLESDGRYAVRVVGNGFPQDGVAYQFALSVPAGVKLEDVRLEMKDASAIDVAKDGRSVRFNGASTKTLADGETFATIVFTLAADAPDTATFAFEVEEFTDAMGKPWDVTFEGTDVDLASVLAGGVDRDAGVNGDDAATKDTPVPGLALTALALVGAALVATRGRREV